MARRVTEKKWAEQSSELRDTSLRRGKRTQAKQRASLVFPPNSNLQEINSSFLFTCGFRFVLLLCLGKDYQHTVAQVKPLCQQERRNPD